MKRWIWMIIIWFIIFFITILIFKSCKNPEPIGKPVDTSSLMDGAYQGRYKQGPNQAEVEVSIQNQEITRIKILKHNEWRGERAEAVIDRIVEKQSTHVEAVSGATRSSYVIMNAVEKAIEKSYRAKQISQ
jgi:uncharacterized protein with FMN-binding domain